MPKAKRFVRLRSRYLSVSRSDRGKSRDRDRNDRPRQEDKKVRFEKDSKSKNYKRDNQKKRDKVYIVDSDISEYQYLSFFFKDGLYAGTNDKDELINYAYNEPFYISIFSHRNTVFNIKINKFNIYKSNLTKTPISDIYIYKLDLSRVIYSGIKINLN